MAGGRSDAIPTPLLDRFIDVCIRLTVARVKVVLLGGAEVGKSELLRVLVDHTPFTPAYTPTLGVDFKSFALPLPLLPAQLPRHTVVRLFRSRRSLTCD